MRRLWFLPLVVLLWVTLIGVAFAEETATLLKMEIPSEGVIGKEVNIKAILTDTKGKPISGAKVEFLSPTEFMGVDSQLKIGSAVTDKEGIAGISFIPKREGELSIIASFIGDGGYLASRDEGKVLVRESFPIYEEESLAMLGIGAWFPALLLGGVWFTFLFAMILILFIARERA